ncbi:MAG: ABC transporter ATP-binding protein/permease [Candidatus Omnitrophica bacterium]|nr:ABC transporter ATP-binding protein/permease [Candidatus Omnitrophota bacterium]
MREYLKLLRFSRPYLGLFGIAIICMVFSTIFDGVSLTMIVPLADIVLTGQKIIIPTRLPSFLNVFVDRLNSLDRQVMLSYMLIATIALFLFKGLFSFLQGFIMSDIGQRVVRDIRSKLYAKMQSLSLDYFTHKRGGELISRITNDVKLVENAVSYGSTDLVYQSLQVILFTFLIFYIHAKLALIAFLLLPLISFSIFKVGRRLRKLSYKTQERMADMNSILYETIIGTRIVKAFNMEDYEIARFNQVNRDYYKLTMKSVKRMLLLSPFTEFMGALAGMFVLFWAGRDVISGRLSFGVFGLFMGSLLSLMRPFKKLSQVHSLNQQALAASNRIYEVLDVPTTVYDKPKAKQLTDFRNNIVFEDVWFSYGNQQVLKGIDLKVKKGRILAIVGPSGAGKTTLVDLLCRFYDPQKGRILIDGIDIKEVTLKSLRQQIGIVTQETILFNDTIRANIVSGRTDVSQKQIEQATMQAYAHDFIKALPQGYDTIIGDRGMKLSGGERQRIAIARALLKDPPILILDEATSQLDGESERIVQEALNRLIEGRTVFVIAHRLSTIRTAHNIVVIDKGIIVERGTHSELIAKEGLYKRLYQVQNLEGL